MALPMAPSSIALQLSRTMSSLRPDDPKRVRLEELAQKVAAQKIALARSFSRWFANQVDSLREDEEAEDGEES